MDIISYILSKSYVDKTLVGMGALKGAPAMISSIVDNPDGTHDITFSWKDNLDVTHTSVLTVVNGETPTIKSTEIEGGHTITFTTTNPSQSVSFNVMDGLEGQRGVSVIRANVDNNNYLKLELSDGNIINAGQIKTVSMVDNTLSLESANPVENRVITTELNKKVNKVSGKQLSTEDFTTAEKNKLANIENGAQVNTLENLIINGEEATIVDKKIALNIITSAVSNLQNYYLKSETYTKTEVEELIGSTVGVTIEIVQELPTVGQTNVIYFLPTETANVYSQYIYTSADGWVLIGSTSVDLSNYYTKGQVDTLLNGKQNVLTIDAFPTAMSNNPVASGGVYSAIAQMQPQFQFTNMPVASESNYGFVYQYIGNAGTYEPNMFYRCVYNTYAGEYRWEEVIFHATVTVDSELSSTSTNPVQNKVVKEALDAKQDVMQFSTMPSAQDNLGKIVQYTGVTTATYQNACFYKAVYDSEHDTYIWNIVRFSADISVDNVLSDVSENPVQNKVITKKFDEYKTAFTGTEEEWDALTSEKQNVYDIMNITNDGVVLNLGIYLEKKTAMPVASEDVANKIYLYTGTTTQNYKKGVVYQCVSDGQTPATYSWVALIDFGTASIKNSTDRVLPNSTDLVESRAVYSAINTALSSIYTPRGNITCAELTSALLISDNIGSVYETSDSGTTTALFLQGAGHPIAVGSNVGVINAGQDRILFNLMPNAFDLTSYQKKDLETPLIIGGVQENTVEDALSALNNEKVDNDSIPYVTPEMFGAVGDGVTDDSSAFTQALAQTLPIYLNAKHYYINADLYITQPNTIIQGKCGAYSTTSPRLIFGNQHGIRIEASIFSATLKDFAIFSSGVGLTLQSASNRMGNLVFEGLYFKCQRDVFIDAETGYIYFRKCHFDFDNTTTYDSDLVRIDYSGTSANRANYISFNQCEFEGQNIPNNMTTTSNGLLGLDNCSNINLTACDICNCHNAINFRNNHGTSQFITLNNNYLWNIKTIANISSCLYFVMTGNSQFTNSGCQPLVFPNNQRGHVIVGNTFAIGSWAAVSVENLYTIFANNYIKGTMTDEVFAKLHIDESQYRKYLDKTSALPTASVNYLNYVYLLTDAQTGYQKGGIYQCVSDGASTPTYSWQNINIQSISNRNLLDNPWFTINQRNLTTYSTPSSGKRFTVDRWAENYHATVVKNTNGITITSDSSGSNGDLGQTIDGLYSYLVGKLVTASVMLQNGKIYSKSDVLNDNLVGAIRFDLENGFKCDVNTNSSNSYLGFYIYSGADNADASISVRAVKLELGGVSTLANDTMPNEAQELAKCMRYFERNNWHDWGCVRCRSAGVLQYGMTYPFLVKKRAVPTFTFNVTGVAGIGNGYVYDITDGTSIPVSEVTLQQPSAYNYRMIQVKMSHSSFVVGHDYCLAVGDNVIDISADL